MFLCHRLLRHILSLKNLNNLFTATELWRKLSKVCKTIKYVTNDCEEDLGDFVVRIHEYYIFFNNLSYIKYVSVASLSDIHLLATVQIFKVLSH